jgi:hypothetical protein
VSDPTIEAQIEEFLTRKSRIVSTKEYEDNGKTLIFNSSRINPDAKGKFGSVIDYTVKEPSSGIERVASTSAITLIRGLQNGLKEKLPGTDVPLLIKKSGEGTQTKYVVEHARSN